MNAQKTVNIPARLAELGHFRPDEPLCVHTGENALVILPRRMTAMQAVQAIDALDSLAEDLLDALTNSCDACEGCPDGCPFEDDTKPDVALSDEALEKLGIPKGHKFGASITQGKIDVSDAGYAHDITDVPSYLLEILSSTGVCLGHLDELLMAEEIVYEA